MHPRFILFIRFCFLLLNPKHSRSEHNAKNITPPMTPPTIAPVLVGLLESVEATLAAAGPIDAVDDDDDEDEDVDDGVGAAIDESW